MRKRRVEGGALDTKKITSSGAQSRRDQPINVCELLPFEVSAFLDATQEAADAMESWASGH